MNKYRIENPNNKDVREYKSRTTGGYTKHYFEEGKRICSKIGSGELQNVNQKVDHMEMDYEAQRSRQFDGITNTYEGCMEITPYINNGNLYDNIIKKYEYQVNSGEPIFYYHSDHLGSASFLTDETGAETQQLVYLPFGEDWVDMKYNTSQFETPYKFNGKEKDPETGYNNYGARYYYDWASIWLYVDPLSDKYPHLTSYNYCANNPIMLVDPDGRELGWYEEGNTMKFNKDINSQKDLNDAGISGKYWGDAGVELNNKGTLNVYMSDGKAFETDYARTLEEVTIDGGKMSEHAKTMSNPIVQSIHQGQSDFIKGTVNMANDMLSIGASAVTLLGYGATIVGGGAVGVPMIGVGEALGRISTGLDTGLKMLDGNYSGAAINAGTFGLGTFGKLGVGKLGLTGKDAKIINTGIDIKSDIINKGGNYINDKKQ